MIAASALIKVSSLDGLHWCTYEHFVNKRSLNLNLWSSTTMSLGVVLWNMVGRLCQNSTHWARHNSIRYVAIQFQPIAAQIICRDLIELCRDVIELCRHIIQPITPQLIRHGKIRNRSRHNSIKLCRDLFRILPRHIICAVIGWNYIAI